MPATGAYCLIRADPRIYIEIKTREIRQNELFKMAQPVFLVTHALFEFYRFCRKTTGFEGQNRVFEHFLKKISHF